MEKMTTADKIVLLFQQLTEKFSETARNIRFNSRKETVDIDETEATAWGAASQELYNTVMKALLLLEKENIPKLVALRRICDGEIVTMNEDGTFTLVSNRIHMPTTYYSYTINMLLGTGAFEIIE